MKIGDKVRTKESVFKDERFNEKEFKLLSIRDDDVYHFGRGELDFLVKKENLADFIEIGYQPKHAKEMVNHPEHYNQGKHECIDEMIALFGIEDVIAFCKCNIYKYKTRASHKNGDEDLAKADWYMDKLLELQGEIKC